MSNVLCLLMEKISLDITAAPFAIAEFSRCELNLLASPDGLAWLIADGGGEALSLKSWEFFNPAQRFSEAEAPLRRVFSNDEKLAHRFGSVRLAFLNKYATLVPNRLFEPASLADYFKLLLRPDEQFSYFFDDLPDLQVKLVFAVEANISNLCDQYFPQKKVQHGGSALLRQWHRLARRSDFDVFVNVRNQHGQVAVFDRKNLQFFNSFNFTKAADFLYFVLLAYEQFRLKPSDIPLTISGELLEDSEVFRLLFRYVRHLRFAPTPDSYRLPGVMEALPSHFNFDLYGLKIN